MGWKRLSNCTIKEKLKFAGVAMIAGLLFFVGVNILINNVFLSEFDQILNLNSRGYYLQQAMSQEKQAFQDYMRDRTEENEARCREAYARSKRCISMFPLSAGAFGKDVYMNVWTIWNVYGYYSQLRAEFLDMDETDAGYLEDLYLLYEIQEYLEVYSDMLMEAVLSWSNAEYLSKSTAIQNQQVALLVMWGLAFLGIIKIISGINHAYIRPLILLAEDAKRISHNDFSGSGVTGGGKDEMGILIREFGRMKEFTKGYMDALRKKSEMEALLHQKEIRQVELEKESEQMRLMVLKSQINPHFLFNTLNIIACNARLEHEQVTSQMIQALSNLLRYNLRTTSVYMPLEQELAMLDHYIYIQRMRFGDRLRFRVECPRELKACMIPSFTLQPIVENSVIHGLSARSRGGTVHVRIAADGERILIAVADNGVGMPKARLRQVRRNLGTDKGKDPGMGIGIGNVARRVRLLFPDGRFAIRSKPGLGTRVVITFRENEEEKDEYGLQDYAGRR